MRQTKYVLQCFHSLFPHVTALASYCRGTVLSSTQKPNRSSQVAGLVCPSNHVSPQISLQTPFQLNGGKRYLSSRNCMEKLISAVGQTSQPPRISLYSLKGSLQANICLPDIQHLAERMPFQILKFLFMVSDIPHFQVCAVLVSVIPLLKE